MLLGHNIHFITKLSQLHGIVQSVKYANGFYLFSSSIVDALPL